MNGIVEGIAGNAIWSGITAGLRSAAGWQIQITYPRPQELLSGAEPLGTDSVAFQIRGKLRHLRKDHEIGLLTEDELTGYLWPQGFFTVQYNSQQGTWLGKINGRGKKQVKIVAVVAPPTSQDFFKYFQTVGHLREYKFEPLKRVPVECTNRTSVQALIP